MAVVEVVPLGGMALLTPVHVNLLLGECIYQRHAALNEGFRDLSTYVPYFLITIFEPKERSKRIEEEKTSRSEVKEERLVGQGGRGRFMYN